MAPWWTYCYSLREKGWSSNKGLRLRSQEEEKGDQVFAKPTCIHNKSNPGINSILPRSVRKQTLWVNPLIQQKQFSLEIWRLFQQLQLNVDNKINTVHICKMMNEHNCLRSFPEHICTFLFPTGPHPVNKLALQVTDRLQGAARVRGRITLCIYAYYS